jgi:hypothetical protein
MGLPTRCAALVRDAQIDGSPVGFIRSPVVWRILSKNADTIGRSSPPVDRKWLSKYHATGLADFSSLQSQYGLLAQKICPVDS